MKAPNEDSDSYYKFPNARHFQYLMITELIVELADHYRIPTAEAAYY